MDSYEVWPTGNWFIAVRNPNTKDQSVFWMAKTKEECEQRIEMDKRARE